MKIKNIVKHWGKQCKLVVLLIWEPPASSIYSVQLLPPVTEECRRSSHAATTKYRGGWVVFIVSKVGSDNQRRREVGAEIPRGSSRLAVPSQVGAHLRERTSQPRKASC